MNNTVTLKLICNQCGAPQTFDSFVMMGESSDIVAVPEFYHHCDSWAGFGRMEVDSMERNK